MQNKGELRLAFHVMGNELNSPYFSPAVDRLVSLPRCRTKPLARKSAMRHAKEKRMPSGRFRTVRHAHVPLGMWQFNARVTKVFATLLLLALAACQRPISAAKSLPPSDDVPLVLASGVLPPDQSRVVEELSVRSRIPTSELRKLLDDCERTQLSVNICALKNFVASELELESALDAKRESASQQCRVDMDRAHAAWKEGRDKACFEETEMDKGGSMWPMLISGCKTAATQARILLLREMDSCPERR